MWLFQTLPVQISVHHVLKLSISTRYNLGRWTVYGHGQNVRYSIAHRGWKRLTCCRKYSPKNRSSKQALLPDPGPISDNVSLLPQISCNWFWPSLNRSVFVPFLFLCSCLLRWASEPHPPLSGSVCHYFICTEWHLLWCKKVLVGLQR